MDRRRVLATVGGGLAALAGCSALPGPDTSTPTSTSTPTPTATPRPVEVVGIDAPSTVEVGLEYEFEVRIRNPNDRAVTFRSGLRLRRDGGSWRSLDGAVGGRVPAGRTRALAASLPAIVFLDEFELQLAVTGRTWSFETVPRRLAFGEAFTSPRDLPVVVDEGRIADSYTGGGTNATARTPTAGDSWFVAPVTVRNPTGEPVTFPPLGAFAASVGGERSAVALSDPSRRLTVSGDQLRVELPFLVPEGTTPADVAVRWQPVYGNRSTGAVWRAADATGTP